jgi:hypothetical protein
MPQCVLFNEVHQNKCLYKNFIIYISDDSIYFLYKMVDRISKKTSYCSEHNGSSSQEEMEASSLSFIKKLIYLKYL